MFEISGPVNDLFQSKYEATLIGFVKYFPSTFKYFRAPFSMTPSSSSFAVLTPVHPVPVPPVGVTHLFELAKRPVISNVLPPSPSETRFRDSLTEMLRRAT